MKKGYFIISIGLSLLVCICALAEEADAPKTCIIRGKVTDIETPSPNSIPDATIILECEHLPGNRVITATTDAAGNYEVRDLPPGEYVVTVCKEGYDDSIAHVTTIAGAESFHNIRLVESITMKDPLDRGGAFWALLVLCIVVVFIYAIRRRSSGGMQNR